MLTDRRENASENSERKSLQYFGFFAATVLLPFASETIDFADTIAVRKMLFCFKRKITTTNEGEGKKKDDDDSVAAFHC